MRKWIEATRAYALVFLLLLPVSPIHAIDSEQVTINGFSSLEIEKQIDEIGLGDPNLSFDADLLDLLINFQIAPNMRVAADFSWEHGFESRRGYGAANLEYAFIEHTFFDGIKIRIGKQLTPFGIFNEIRRAKPAYFSVKIPNNTRPIGYAPLGFSLFPGAGVGFGISGETVYEYSKTVDYNIFVSNGLQDSAMNPFEYDGNVSKSITGRFRFDIISNLKVGKSFYLDRPSEKGMRFLFTDGYEVEWQLQSLRLIGEMVFGYRWSHAGDIQKQRGIFIQPSYSFPYGVTPYLRGEFFSPTSRRHDFSSNLVSGIHYEISNGYIVKTEINYFHFGENSAVRVIAGEGYTEMKASLVLGF